MVDLVSIAVPTELHHAVAHGFLDAGVHVLVEKPIAKTLEEADALVALGGQARRAPRRGAPRALQRGVPRACRGAWSGRCSSTAERLSGFKRRGADVDVVLDLMIHDLDLVLALAGGELAQVSACGFRCSPTRSTSPTCASSSPTACVANLSASRVSQSPVRKLRVFQPGATPRPTCRPASCATCAADARKRDIEDRGGLRRRRRAARVQAEPSSTPCAARRAGVDGRRTAGARSSSRSKSAAWCAKDWRLHEHA
jgi:hypothetical protein